jgi:hypothetical protein
MCNVYGKVRWGCPLATGRSSLTYLPLTHPFCGTRCFYAHLLLHRLSCTLWLLDCAYCGCHHCEACVSSYCIFLIYQAHVNVLFYCGKCPLRPRICLLLPSVLTSFWTWSFPILQWGPSGEVLVWRHLLLARRRCFLVSFLLCSSVVYMSAILHHLSMYMISLLQLMLVACMSSRNCLWIDFLARPSFW